MYLISPVYAKMNSMVDIYVVYHVRNIIIMLLSLQRNFFFPYLHLSGLFTSRYYYVMPQTSPSVKRLRNVSPCCNAISV